MRRTANQLIAQNYMIYIAETLSVLNFHFDAVLYIPENIGLSASSLQHQCNRKIKNWKRFVSFIRNVAAESTWTRWKIVARTA